MIIKRSLKVHIEFQYLSNNQTNIFKYDSMHLISKSLCDYLIMSANDNGIEVTDVYTRAIPKIGDNDEVIGFTASLRIVCDNPEIKSLLNKYFAIGTHINVDKCEISGTVVITDYNGLY